MEPHPVHDVLRPVDDAEERSLVDHHGAVPRHEVEEQGWRMAGGQQLEVAVPGVADGADDRREGALLLALTPQDEVDESHRHDEVGPRQHPRAPSDATRCPDRRCQWTVAADVTDEQPQPAVRAAHHVVEVTAESESLVPGLVGAHDRQWAAVQAVRQGGEERSLHRLRQALAVLQQQA